MTEPQNITSVLDKLDRAKRHIKILIDNDPDEVISDAGHTVLDLWRHEAKSLVDP